MNLNAVGLIFGTAFGFVLGWARLTDYDVIHDMLMLREPDVFLIMGSAIATAAVGVRVLRAFRVRSIVDGTPVKWAVDTPRPKHLWGSALFGVGWSVAATCPGPVAAQVGRGQFAGLFTIAGLLAGIVVCDRVRARRRRAARPLPLGEAANVVGL
jgi:uncharacterized membrane protein YedE/YeeE